MARIMTRINIDKTLEPRIARAALALSLSKSEIVNRALAASLKDPTGTLDYLRISTPSPTEGFKAAGFSLDKGLLEEIEVLTTCWYVTKHQFARWALEVALEEHEARMKYEQL